MFIVHVYALVKHEHVDAFREATLENARDGTPSPFDLASPDAKRRLVALLRLVVSRPEFQLN